MKIVDFDKIPVKHKIALSRIYLTYLVNVKRYGKFENNKEAYSLIFENLEELWFDINEKAYYKKEYKTFIREIRLIGSMTLNFMLDLYYGSSCYPCRQYRKDKTT